MWFWTMKLLDRGKIYNVTGFSTQMNKQNSANSILVDGIKSLVYLVFFMEFVNKKNNKDYYKTFYII